MEPHAVRPLRVLILGHSDTFGTQLPDRSAAWPQIVLRELPALVGRPVELHQRPLLPLRPDKGARAESILQGFPADIVIFATNPYGFAVETVANRVQQRFGERFSGRYLKLEKKLDAWTRNGRMGRAVNHGTRRVVRKVIGTAPNSSYQEVVDAHMEILRVLARDEQLQVMVQGGNKLSSWLQKEDKTLTERVETLGKVVQQFCREHHFTWFDTEAALLPGARERSFLPDGVHRNPEAHRHFADIILPILREMAEKALESEPGVERHLSAQV
jgi:hypothetical protein